MFDWDAANEEHIARHGISTEEAEEALLDRRRIGVAGYNLAGERRWAVIGATESSRILFVVFTRRGGLVRVVSARDATGANRRRYRKD